MVLSNLAAESELDERKIKEGKMPGHTVIIPDANRRWSIEHGIPIKEAYRIGVEKADEIAHVCLPLVNNLTFYTLSMKNNERPEASEILEVIGEGLERLRDKPILESEDVRVNILGNRYILTPRIRDLSEEIERKTKNHSKRTLNLLLGYDPWEEIRQMYKGMRKDGVIDPTPDTIRKYLYTANIPDVDLVIRTGEERLSGMLPLQTTYAELVFFPHVYWPDFTEKHLLTAFAIYQQRDRRFGR